MYTIISICKGGGYLYAKTEPIHPKANSKGLYPLHRVLMENKLNRNIEDDEVVHHIDGNKNNNDLNNLEVMKRSEHTSIHQLKGRNIIVVTCDNCGISFEREKRSVYRNTKNAFCSKKCSGKYYSFIGKRKKDANHGVNMYRHGCRCDICKKAHAKRARVYRARKKNK